MCEDLPVIEGFDDAVATILELSSTFRRAHVAVPLDSKGRVLDFTVFTRQDHTVDHALEWASCLKPAMPEVRRIVLLSVVAESGDELQDAALEKFRRARSSLAADGVELADWIVGDGEMFRSFAFTEGVDSWGPPPSWMA